MFELLWIVVSLAAVTLLAALAKRWGAGVLMALVAATIIAANILATKPIRMFGCIVPAGVIVYSVSFLLTDALSEFYGRRTALRAVLLGFLGNALYVVSLLFVLIRPHAFGAQEDVSFQAVLSLSWRVTLASMAAYLAAQLHDVTAYDFWGRLTRGRKLWLRNNASTAVSQLIDTLVFISVAFAGVRPLLPLIQGQLVVKLVVAAADTGCLYLLRRLVFRERRYRVFAPGWTEEEGG